MALLTTFPRISEFEKACKHLDAANVPYRLISPTPGYSTVGVPALIIDEEHRPAFATEGVESAITSGWVDYTVPKKSVPALAPEAFEEDIFGTASVMVLQPCHADLTKLRAVVHITGDLTEVFPYMNAVRRNAFYNVNGQTFTIMEAYRIITLYPRRIAVAKADDIVDLWRILEELRTGFNQCWRNRKTIVPSHELRKRPAALEIYYRLPKTNCGACGEKACMAFALKLWGMQMSVSKCTPVFEGSFGHLKDALMEICVGLGVQKE